MSIILENIKYVYMPKSPYEVTAVDDISFDINDGEIVSIIGHTGSGKSTLVQMLNGLIRPSSGHIMIDGEDITSKKVKLRDLRFKVGLVFQYPEHQLFEETVYKDVAFGPTNMNLSKDDVDNRVKEALTMVGLSDRFLQRSPFELSGGEKRRVAIAGVIAMRPKYIILDEPAAGLDPAGRDEILNMINQLNKKYRMTVIMVSHSMEDVGKMADRVIVMNKAKLEMCDTPQNVFKQITRLEQIGLAAPQITYLMKALREKGYDVKEDIINIEEAEKEILKIISKGELI